MKTTTKSFPTQDLFEAGQSPWLDFISRSILDSGALKELISAKGVKGVTSNPSIFEKAISDSKAGYEKDIQRLIAAGATTFEIYDSLTIADIRRACDLFLPVFNETKGGHGFVSLEVSPVLSYKTEETLHEARRLFKAVNRPNLMVKIPATKEGIPAIQAAISEGININITLMFSRKHYHDVAWAYINGLRNFKRKGGDLRKVFSVASVFVSRIDTLLDKKLEAQGKNNSEVLELRGKAAVANSKQIYQDFKEIFCGREFESLKSAGANVQKVLWGSTSCKNPAYPDLIYVETLVGKDTVNTMPQNTLESLLDHGNVTADTIEKGIGEANLAVQKLKKAGFNLEVIGEQLQKDGVKLFMDAFDSLMKTIEVKKMEKLKAGKKQFGSLDFSMSAEITDLFKKKAAEFERKNFLERFFNKDVSLWKDDAVHQAVIQNRLGWVRAHEWMLGKVHEIDHFVDEIRAAKITSVVLLGMGGSSLAPEVMSLICKPKAGKHPKFFMLDTTDPSAILTVEKKINLKSTLFIVASKSGGTVETVSQFRYFYERVQKTLGAKAGLEKVGSSFIAITDEGSGLQKTAEDKKFRKVFVNLTDIGGRFSAISFFGLVPAALMGIDIRELLKSAESLFQVALTEKDLTKNPAVAPGILLGILAQKGIDKLTLLGAEKCLPFGAWLEQLIAESTGKEGRGVIPVDTEPCAPASFYGKDRVFLFIGSKTPSEFRKNNLSALSLEWPSPTSLGAEFLRWEIVTSVAGMVLGINPFDEPNVKESKDATGKILSEFKATGKLIAPAKDAKSADLPSFLSKLKKNGYVVLLSYTQRTPTIQKAFNRSRSELRKKLGCPVLLGFGPRYLHSIGQLYKGGPRTGLFVEFFAKDLKDIKVPGEFYSFAQLKTAQGLGDKEAIESKGLPVLCLQLGRDILSGIKIFEKKVFEFAGEKPAKKRK